MYVYNYVQVEAEFCLICGEDTTQKMEERWFSLLPKILQHGGTEIPEAFTASTMLDAIKIMDRSFRPLGAAAKFSTFKVIFRLSLYLENKIFKHMGIQL